MEIDVQFRIIRMNVAGNLVCPFYLSALADGREGARDLVQGFLYRLHEPRQRGDPGGENRLRG